MDDAERAHSLRCLDDMLELVEAHIDEDQAEWLQRINAIAQRQDGSFEEVVNLLSLYAAITTEALARKTRTPIDEALTDGRRALMKWIEES